jgi:hypothetical protein
VNADAALNMAARFLLLACSPATTHRVMVRVGAMLPQRRSRDEIARASARMGTRGTCLTRALAIAARTPSAEVVVGVQSPKGDRLNAHAWIEIAGKPLEPTNESWYEIARLRVPS